MSMKTWVKITCSFSAWLACISIVFFYTPCFPSSPRPCGFLGAVWFWPLANSPWQLGSYSLVEGYAEGGVHRLH